MRILYSILIYCLIPIILLRLFLRGLRAPAYRRRWLERFGFFHHLPNQSCLWIHAVSVGEVNAAAGIIKSIAKRYPTIPITITTMTPTGSDRVRALFGAQVTHVYVPYDLSGSVSRFLNRVQPGLAIIMETELWPNLIYHTHKKNIPIVLMNARLSAKSAKGYMRIRYLIRQTLSMINAFVVQGQDDAARLVALGADNDRVSVTGSIKFDIQLPGTLPSDVAQLRSYVNSGRLVWIAASTQDGEEELIIKTYCRVKRVIANLMLVLVPRHPERFQRVEKLCEELGVQCNLRSKRTKCSENTDVFLGDSMGELLSFYGIADIAYVGGSLVATGGQNPLEPAMLALPIVFGPHMFNFQEISESLIASGGAIQVRDVDDLERIIIELAGDKHTRDKIGTKSKSFILANRGATDRAMDIIEPYLALIKDAGPDA